jgi:Protein of unknown function (DUF2795)
MERGNTEHGRHLDDELRAETRFLTKSQPGAGRRSSEWRDPEPPGEDQPDDGQLPDATAGRRGGAPSGMTADERDERSDLGRYLPRSAFPGSAERLVLAAQEWLAPDAIIDQLRQLPAREYRNVAEVYAELVGSTEGDLEQRF